jgi:hypothetical protein
MPHPVCIHCFSNKRKLELFLKQISLNSPTVTRCGFAATLVLLRKVEEYHRSSNPDHLHHRTYTFPFFAPQHFPSLNVKKKSIVY